MQNTKILPVNPPNRKILITYKKVDKLAIQGDFKLSKSGYNWLEVTEDEILKIEGVTSLEIDNLGDEEVIINGFTLLPLPRDIIGANKPVDGLDYFWSLIDRAVKRNSNVFVLPDGTYSDVTLNINFLGQEVEFITNPPVPQVPFDENTYLPNPINTIVESRNNFNFFNQAQVVCGGEFVGFSTGTLAEVKAAYLVPINLGCGGSTHVGTIRSIAGDIHVGTDCFGFGTPPTIDTVFNGNFVADTNISPELYPGIPPATRAVITVVNGIVTAITNFNAI